MQLQFTFKVGIAQFPAILAETVSVAQSLNLHREDGLQSVRFGRAGAAQVKRACWVLFCIDKAYAMRWRTFSVSLELGALARTMVETLLMTMQATPQYRV